MKQTKLGLITDLQVRLSHKIEGAKIAKSQFAKMQEGEWTPLWSPDPTCFEDEGGRSFEVEASWIGDKIRARITWSQVLEDGEIAGGDTSFVEMPLVDDYRLALLTILEALKKKIEQEL